MSNAILPTVEVWECFILVNGSELRDVSQHLNRHNFAIIAKPTPDLNWLVRLEQRLHKPETHEFLKTLHPIQRIGKVSEVVDVVFYLTQATFVTGEVLHVDGGAHAGKW